MLDSSQKRIILALRRLGVSSVKIGLYFGVTHGVILYHVKNPTKPIIFKTKRRDQPATVPDPEAISKEIIAEAKKIIADQSYLPTLTDTRRLGGRPRKGTGSGNWKRRPKDIIPKYEYATPGAEIPKAKTYADYVKKQKEFTRDEKGAIIKISEPKKPHKFNKFLGAWS